MLSSSAISIVAGEDFGELFTPPLFRIYMWDLQLYVAMNLQALPAGLLVRVTVSQQNGESQA